MKSQNGVPIMLSWAEELLNNTKKLKLSIISDVLKNIRDFKFFMGLRKKGESRSEDEEVLFNLLTSKDMKLMGFVPNFTYISANEKKSMYIHAFGTYTLAFAHKKLPIIILTNPTLLVDDSILRLVKNEKNILKELKVTDGSVKGITS